MRRSMIFSAALHFLVVVLALVGLPKLWDTSPMVETPLVAFHTGGFGNEPLATVLPAIRDAGFDAVELNAETLPWCGPHVWPGMPEADQARIADLLEETKLTVTSICAHIPMIAADEAKRRAAVDYVTGCIDLGPPACILYPLGVSVNHGSSEDVRVPIVLVVAAAAAACAGFAFLQSGWADVAATSPHWSITRRILSSTMKNAVERRARDIRVVSR